MDIYLAADFARKSKMQGCRHVIETLGHKVVSTWIDDHDLMAQYTAPAEGAGIGGQPITDDGLDHYAHIASRNHEDLQIADMVILFTTGEPSRGGRHTELGMALAYHKQIAIVWPRENVFQCVPTIVQYPTWKAFIAEFLRGYLA